MTHRLEKMLAEHCAPVLVGSKAANLFSHRVDEGDLAHCSTLLQPAGILLREMGKRNGRTLVFVYRPALLQNALRRPRTRQTLAGLGYPVGRGMESMLTHLALRMERDGGFPHEIGFFLDYPPADVEGFMQYRGRAYKHSGVWKVYDDVDYACSLFRRYSACKSFLTEYVDNGGSIACLCRGRSAGVTA